MTDSQEFMPKTKDQLLRKSPASDQLVQGMLEEDKRFKQKQREAIVLAKQDPAKQPFDIEAFGSIYNLRGDDGELRITPDLIEEYEAEYYLENPDIKSIEEFADHRRRLDEQNVG